MRDSQQPQVIVPENGHHTDTAQLGALAQISSTLARLTSPAEIVVTAVHGLQSSFNLSHAYVYLLTDEELNHEQSAVARAAGTGQTVIVHDTQDEPGYLPQPHLPETRSEMAIPLIVGPSLLGVLAVQAREINYFTKATASLITMLAASVALALQNTQHEGKTQQEEDKAAGEQITQEFLEKLKALNEVTVILSQVDTTEELYHQAIEWGRQALGFDRIGFYIHEPNDETYLLQGTFGTNAAGEVRDERSLTLNLLQIPEYISLLSNKQRVLISEDSELWDDGQVVGKGWHMAAPAWDNDTFFGIFFVDNLWEKQPLKPYEPELLTLYSEALANLFTRKKSQEALAKQAVQLEAVAQVSTAVSQTLDPNELLQNVVDLTKERFNLYHAHIYLLDDRGTTLNLTAGAGQVGRQMVAEKRHIPLSQTQSLVAQAARNRHGVISNNVRSDAHFLPHPLLPQTKSEMAVPIMLGGEIVGVLDIQSQETNYFTEEDIRTQLTLATQVAVALQNSRLFAESERAREEMNALTRRLTRQGWQEYLNTRQAFDDAVYEYDVETADQNETTGAPVEQSLIVQGEQIGRLAMVEARELPDDAAEIMAAVAERLSAHLENLRLSEQTQIALSETEEQARRLALLNQMSAALSTAPSLEEVYRTAVEQTADIMNVDRVSLPLLAKDGEHMIVVALHGEAYEATIGNQIDLYGPMATALRENRLVHSKPQQGLMKSIMVAPLFVASRAIGTINIGNKSETAFGARDESLLLQIASLLAARIENLRLFTDAQARAERERRVRTITDKIHQATNREAILQIAREEISQLLGASRSAVQLGTQQQLMSAQEKSTTPPDSNNGKGNSS